LEGFSSAFLWTLVALAEPPRRLPSSTTEWRIREAVLSVRLIFAWYDFWVGVFFDRDNRRIYLFPIPMVGLMIQLPIAKCPTCKGTGAQEVPDGTASGQCWDCYGTGKDRPLWRDGGWQ